MLSIPPNGISNSHHAQMMQNGQVGQQNYRHLSRTPKKRKRKLRFYELIFCSRLESKAVECMQLNIKIKWILPVPMDTESGHRPAIIWSDSVAMATLISSPIDFSVIKQVSGILFYEMLIKLCYVIRGEFMYFDVM